MLDARLRLLFCSLLISGLFSCEKKSQNKPEKEWNFAVWEKAQPTEGFREFCDSIYSPEMDTCLILFNAWHTTTGLFLSCKNSRISAAYYHVDRKGKRLSFNCGNEIPGSLYLRAISSIQSLKGQGIPDAFSYSYVLKTDEGIKTGVYNVDLLYWDAKENIWVIDSLCRQVMECAWKGE